MRRLRQWLRYRWRVMKGGLPSLDGIGTVAGFVVGGSVLAVLKNYGPAWAIALVVGALFVAALEGGRRSGPSVMKLAASVMKLAARWMACKWNWIGRSKRRNPSRPSAHSLRSPTSWSTCVAKG
jgi:hypothetical protein